MAAQFKSCAIAMCNRNAHFTSGGRGGLCGSHYGRKLRHGSPTLGNADRGAPMAWLQAHAGYDAPECLIWPFGLNSGGRGSVVFGGKTTLAHRVMCILAHGHPPSTSHEAAHSCGNGHLACVNPNHLRWATRSENMADRVLHGTATRGERSGRVKITDAEAAEILSLLSTWRNKDIAARYGIDQSYVSQIRHGKRRGYMGRP